MLEIEYDINHDRYLTMVAGEILAISDPKTQSARDALARMASDRWAKCRRAATRQVDTVSGDA